MQLKILAAMEKAVEEFIGVHMPIQEFFDLIVGTRYDPVFLLDCCVRLTSSLQCRRYRGSWSYRR